MKFAHDGEERVELESVEQQFHDISHTAPQHRKVLGVFYIHVFTRDSRLQPENNPASITVSGYSIWLQYLEYEGVGSGNPSQRQKQYEQYRIYKATERSQEYAINKQIQENAVFQVVAILNSLLQNNVGEGKRLAKFDPTALSKEQAYFSKKQRTT